jgi:hypothetical protein
MGNAVDSDAITRTFLAQVLQEITLPDGSAAIDRFPGLRQVDAKGREVKTILKPLTGAIAQLTDDLERDLDFQANSRRVRLEALGNYCRSAIRFLDHGVAALDKAITPCPSLGKITASVPQLDHLLQARWLEAQKCQNVGAYLSAVILMGSILEGLLLAVATEHRGACYRASQAPKQRDGSARPVEQWTLSQLIDVAVELRWLKTDRGRFGHALRESRNVVHPWEQMASKADFDEATCKTCWHVLNASVEDLLQAAP